MREQATKRQRPRQPSGALHFLTDPENQPASQPAGQGDQIYLVTASTVRCPPL
nr:MAG TPA: hypothetical protein [Herelleviridae sp.]